MPPKPFRSDETRQWLQYAREDLQAAEVLISTQPGLLRIALFHCQQTVEKALKAFLVWHEQPFTKTHDLVPLGDQCVTLDPSLEEAILLSLQLNQFAVRFRYPGEAVDPSLGEAKEWLSVAHSLLNAVLQRLPKDVRT